MSTTRDRQKLAQRFLKEKGHYAGIIDGIWGGKSEAAYQALLAKEHPVPDSAGFRPPAPDYHSMVRAFGKPGDESNLVRFSFPYPMRLAWDTSKTVKTSRCHRLIRKPLVAALRELLDTHGMDWIRQHGLDLFGGIYNDRSVRGGRAKSKHAWGVAIDLNPDENGNRTPWVPGKQRSKGYATMPQAAIQIFEKHGFKSAARAWGRDAMHFQFTT